MKKEIKEFKPTKYEKKKYKLPGEKSIEILIKVKKLEKQKLNKKDKEIVKLIRTQLEDDWETPLIKYLNKLLKKYKK